MPIDPQRIRDAQSLLARHFGPTRIARAASLSSPGHDVFLKLETDLPTGSFKVRGAIYALAAKVAVPQTPVAEVVCASTGNHGAAVAYAARLLGARATIFLPVDPNPSWHGYSTGRWEGDTLVVRTNGLRDGMWLDMSGTPLTDAATLTERITRPSYGTLEIAFTVDDPKAYTKPWTVNLRQEIIVDTDLVEEICLEGLRPMHLPK